MMRFVCALLVAMALLVVALPALAEDAPAVDEAVIPPPSSIEGEAIPDQDDGLPFWGIELKDGDKQGIAVIYEQVNPYTEESLDFSFSDALMEWLPDEWRANDMYRPETVILVRDSYYNCWKYDNGQQGYRHNMLLTAFDAQSGELLWEVTALGEYPAMMLPLGKSPIGEANFEEVADTMLDQLYYELGIERESIRKYIPDFMYMGDEDGKMEVARAAYDDLGERAIYELLDRLYAYELRPLEDKQAVYLLFAAQLATLSEDNVIQAYFDASITSDMARGRMLMDFPTLKR